MRATLNSPYGLIESAWQLSDADFRLKVTVPTNSHATVSLPASSLNQVTLDGKPLTNGKLANSKLVDGNAVVEIGSGSYEFVTTAINLPQVMANVRHVAGRLDRHCTLSDFLMDEKAKAVLVEQIGGDFLSSTVIGFAMSQPLEIVSNMMPGVLSAEKLDAIEKALR